MESFDPDEAVKVRMSSQKALHISRSSENDPRSPPVMSRTTYSQYSKRKMTLPDEREQLLNEIIDILGTSDAHTPANILLLGRTGSGKSALINTVHKAITGRYYNIAIQGRGNGQSVTLDLIRYDNCGVLINRISDENRRRRMEIVMRNLPHIWDCAGLGDENTPKLRELLELLIGGYIRPGTSIEALEEMQRKYGIGRLKNILESSNASWKVSKIAFLVACTDAIPKNLIDCLKDILRVYDRRTLIRKYQCEVYVVITKYDLVRDPSETNLGLHGTNTENALSSGEFQSFEDSIGEEFSFGGALTSHSLRWTSLTDSVGYDDTEVDKTALEFLKRMVEPGVPRTVGTAPLIRDENMLHMYRCFKILEEVVFQLMKISKEVFLKMVNIIQNNPDNPYVIFGIITSGVIVFAVFYRLLKAAF